MTAWVVSQNFKHQVLLKVQGGQSIPSVAQELGISEGIIYQWIEKMGNPGNNRVSDLEKEVAQLRQHIEASRNGARHSKKSDCRAATVIFAKSG